MDNGMKTREALISIFVSCVLFSFSGLLGDFVFDDRLAIVTNADTTPDSSFLALWSHDIWGKHMLAHDSHHSYRPFLILLFKVLRMIHDSPVFLRMVSIASHMIASVSFYFMAEEVTGLSDLALDSALLFASHPVHVEAVTALVNMAEPIHCIFYIAAFRIYYKDAFLRTGLVRSDRSKRHINIVFWTLYVACSILFKETGITVVGVILGTSMVDLVTQLFRVGAGFKVVAETWWARHSVWVGLSVSMALAYAAFRVLLMKTLHYIDGDSMSALGSSGVYLESSDLIRKAENPFAFLEGTELMFSLMYLHFRYMLALLFPATLCAEYSFDCIPAVKSIGDGRFWLSVLMYVSLVGLVLAGVRLAARATPDMNPTGKDRKRDQRKEMNNKIQGRGNNKLPTPRLSVQTPKPAALIQALVWLLVSFVPASGVFLRLGTLLAERLLYVPSCGFCLVLAMSVHYLCASVKLRYPSLAFARGADVVSRNSRSPLDSIKRITPSRWVIVAIWTLYILKSFYQNLVWKDEVSLFTASLATCPRSAKLNLQVAKIFVNSVSSPSSTSTSQGNLKIDNHSLSEKERVVALQKARFHVNKAKEIDPTFCDVGYQEALLQVLLHRNYTGAIEALVDNLSCKFTARNSLTMLESLWESQLEQVGASSKDGYPLLKVQGEQAAQGGMKALAAQKFSMASQGAIKHSAYLDALLLAVMAEETMAQWLASDDAMEEKDKAGIGFAKALEMHAGLLFRGGRIRRLVQRTIEEGQRALDEQHPLGEGTRLSVWDKIQIPLRLEPELPRAKEVLFAALERQQESFRFVRERVRTDEEALNYLYQLGADPKLVSMTLDLLEEAITSKLDMEAVALAAQGDIMHCKHRQVANLVDYAAMQERTHSLLPSSNQYPHSRYTKAEIANLYKACAASIEMDMGQDTYRARKLSQKAATLMSEI